MSSLSWVFCLSLVGILAGVVNALPTLSIQGTKFFDPNGNQFYIKGIAYQRSPEDPFVNTTQCQLDAALMKTLGVNTIRTYHVDPTQNHDGCMEAFDSNGIYVFLDMDTFTTQIEETGPEWNDSQFTLFVAVINAFAGYENLAGFFVANEAVTDPAGIVASPYVKAATRDTKAYMKSYGGRYVPIGYSAADIASIRPMFQNYLACGDTADTIDFFALNIYEWCGDVDYETSGYSQRIAELQGYPTPAFFSEDGCIAVRPRTFNDIPTIFGPDMAPILSGVIMYEWTQETNDYGIITYPDNTIQDGVEVPCGSPVPMQPEFGNLQSQYAAASPSSIALSAYSVTTAVFSCPATTPGVWTIDGNAALPPAASLLALSAVLGSSATAGGGPTPTVTTTSISTSSSGTTPATATTSHTGTLTSGIITSGTGTLVASPAGSTSAAGTKSAGVRVERNIFGFSLAFLVFTCIALGCLF